MSEAELILEHAIWFCVGGLTTLLALVGAVWLEEQDWWPPGPPGGSH